MKRLIMLLSLTTTAVLAQHQYAPAQQQTTPVPILKQINRHNEDGSYSFGYEGADGSFKIETKHPNGEVFGKYGYVDDTGKVHEVEYGASKRGFEPQGTDINVPPPTMDNNSDATRPLAPGEEDDGQYREDPSVYYRDDKYNRPAAAAAVAPQQYKPQPTYTAQQYEQPQYYQPKQQPQQQPQQHRFQVQAEPQRYYQPPVTQQQQYQQPRYTPHHPSTTGFDINTGSYSVSYTG